jgi:hypothetical protein
MMKAFLAQGITAMASVVALDMNNWFNGHIGASLLAGAGLLRSGQLSPEAASALSLCLQRQLERYKPFFACVDNSPISYDYTPVIDAIELNSQQLSRSGHGIIYGSLFLDAVINGGITASKMQIDNIARLIRNCAEDKWSRYYGIDDYRAFEPQIKPVDIEHLCRLAVEKSTQDVFLDADGYFFSGEKVHAITHAQAILLLQHNGFDQQARQAATQLAKQLILNDRRPTSGLISASPKRFDLTDKSTWESHLKDEHQIKLVYSYTYLTSALSGSLPKLDLLWGAIN